jgi:hypothetical protein
VFGGKREPVNIKPLKNLSDRATVLYCGAQVPDWVRHVDPTDVPNRFSDGQGKEGSEAG